MYTAPMRYLFYIFLTIAPSLPAASADMRLATGEIYSSMIDAKKPDGGILTENIRRIFLDMGHKATFDHMPWQRAYTETAKTNYAATFPWFRDPEREVEFLFSDPLYSMPVVGVVKSGSPLDRLDFTTMRGKTSCELLGSKSYDVLKEKANVKVVFVKDLNQCHQMLLTGRIDFLFTAREIAEANLKLGIRIVPDVLNYKLSLHLIISRKWKDAEGLMAAFNQSLRKLSETHALNPIELHDAMKP